MATGSVDTLITDIKSLSLEELKEELKAQGLQAFRAGQIYQWMHQKLASSFAKTLIGNREYRSITNIGKKPTVNQEDRIGVETYIYEFDQDVYGKSAIVKLLAFRRPEMKFDGVEALKEQMMKDVQAGREWEGYHSL